MPLWACKTNQMPKVAFLHAWGGCLIIYYGAYPRQSIIKIKFYIFVKSPFPSTPCLRFWNSREEIGSCFFLSPEVQNAIGASHRKAIFRHSIFLKTFPPRMWVGPEWEPRSGPRRGPRPRGRQARRTRGAASCDSVEKSLTVLETCATTDFGFGFGTFVFYSLFVVCAVSSAVFHYVFVVVFLSHVACLLSVVVGFTRSLLVLRSLFFF